MWLRYAQCLTELTDISAAIRAYKKVVQLAPFHQEARVSLSLLLRQKGETQEALEVLMYGKRKISTTDGP